ncbi:tyrosyl-DNA phosphodiesterase, putative [Entamoeba invadens IP1]|uniref:Tyrosyl-DNA phosphodiesterase, putative n=1 Tax=Entamoeba invadens IP1 TaxID=370355 RepID=A0A0A1UH58_ENTIV|nr:tyrosyl-DNA phosphodiesterase, putative [Entamoeba invadens IP1]ELP94746.1 tyrosyl-DNA phosphodiesterase, putative [Entamoeba invadens IP1]|eukprot:XP_004261517.1 tyrosyl-DNA phosphodiesterase, putative [Entamoeba invadens IP1]
MNGLGVKPYFYFNHLSLSDQMRKEKDTITLKELFNTPGELYACFLTTFVFDIGWLLREVPILKTVQVQFVHDGSLSEDEERLIHNLDFQCIKVSPFRGCHHVKIMVMLYEGGLRFVLSTGNLLEQDYEIKTNGIYVRDFKPKSNSFSKMNDIGEHFLTTMRYYLNSINTDIGYLDDFDFSTIDAWLLLSVPGKFHGDMASEVGLGQLSSLLKSFSFGSQKDQKTQEEHKTSALINPVVPTKQSQKTSTSQKGLKSPEIECAEQAVIISQSSSLGYLSSNFTEKFKSSFVPNVHHIQLKTLWPTEDFVRVSATGYAGGQSLFLTQQNVKSGVALYRYEPRFPRHYIQPHIKTYLVKVGDTFRCGVLTSANMSAAAWGKPMSYGIDISNFEMGLLFVENFDVNRFKIPFDSNDLKAYGPDDRPWIVDVDHSVMDSEGYIMKDGNLVAV